MQRKWSESDYGAIKPHCSWSSAANAMFNTLRILDQRLAFLKVRLSELPNNFESIVALSSKHIFEFTEIMLMVKIHTSSVSTMY